MGKVQLDRMNSLDKAICLAVSAHQGVMDKNNVPYIWHPIRVALMAQQLGLDTDSQAIAVLHDTVEDTEITLEYLSRYFSFRVVDGVDAMTRRNKKNVRNEVEEPYFDFVRRASLNPDARKIKMLDNADNMRPERTKPGKFSLPERYNKSLDMLKTACSVANDWEYVRKFEELVTWV